jgi:hypothetical protein
MKKKICVMAMSALMLTACSDEIENEINGSQASEGARYMAINIVSNGAATTRGDDDPTFSNGDEYQINDVLFYFFDENGDPYYVATNASGERVNYTTPKDVDLSGTEYATSDGKSGSTSTDGSNVTLSKSIVVIEPKYEDGTLPSQVVALINYDNNSVFTPATYKLDDLRKVDVKQGYYTVSNSDNTKTYYYLMSNSVYKTPVYDTSTPASITGYTEQYAVPITSANISATATGGTAVNIYVERVVAKVATIYNTTSTDGKKATAYTPSTSSTTTYYVFPNAKYVNLASDATKTAIKKLDTETAVNVEDLQIMITGYSYYNNSSKATLLKNIESNAAYHTDILGTSTTTSADDFLSKWNDPTNFRSYWADTIANATEGEGSALKITDTYVTTQQIAYKDITTTTAGYMYPFENTRKILNTGIIFSAQLVTKDATANTYTAQPLVKWLSTYYTPDAALAAIATYLSTDYATTAFSTVENAAVAQTAISASDLEFVTNGDDFHAKVQFKSSVTTIYKKGGTTGITGDALTAVTNAVPSIQYWNGGKCYFFAQITQLPGTIGVSGVVRNHWYQMTVNSISGLGTPVADPEQAVTPVKPTEDEWYISTSINVLAWKRSYQGVDLTTD